MALVYSFLVQEQWFEVRADTETSAISEFLDQLVDNVEARERLERDANRLIESVRVTDVPDRHTWGGVGDRGLGALSAVMTVEPAKARGVDLARILDEWSSTESIDGADIWLQDYRYTELAGRPAVSGHHIVQWPESESGERRLTEVYRAAITAPGLSTYIVMTITTDDLTVFDDIVGYGDIIAGAFEFSNAS